VTARPLSTARLVLAMVAAALVMVLVPRAAHAADAGTSGASISPQYYAPRYMQNSDAGAPPHYNDFSPLAINYADCVNQIDIEFALNLSEAPAGDEIQVWAGSGSADCTQVSARTAGASATPGGFPGRCWPVAPPGTFSPTGSTSTARLHVLDLVAHIGDPNPPTTYTQTISSSVCKPNATSTAVDLNIYFFFAPTGSGRGTVAATAPDGITGLYQTPAALVGPFAPTGVSVPNSGITATSLTVNWVPQSEAIIQGYNVYYEDQGPGGIRGGKLSPDAGASLVYGIECHPVRSCIPDSGTPKKDSGTARDAAKDGHEDGSRDAGAHDATLADAGATHDAGDPPDSGDGDGGELDGGDGGETDAQVAAMCDGGFVDAWVPEDAATYAGETPAQLMAQGCELTGPFNTITTNGGSQNLTCNSAVLIDQFTVDGGIGSSVVAGSDSGVTGTLPTTVSDDAGIDAGVDSGVDSGTISLTGTTATNVPEVAGISFISASQLAFYATGATTNSYTFNNLHTGDQYAIGVAAVDSYGNVGPLGGAISPQTGAVTGGLVACSVPTPVEDFFTRYGLDGGTAGGGFCALGAVGQPAPFFASVFGVGIAIAGLGRARRRGRRARSRDTEQAP
jgi:hypothetical protein